LGARLVTWNLSGRGALGPTLFGLEISVAWISQKVKPLSS